VEELSEQLGVSTGYCAARDLGCFRAEGLLRRTHGGAVSMDPCSMNPSAGPFLCGAGGAAAEEKRRIGGLAAALIRPGETIALIRNDTTRLFAAVPMKIQHHCRDKTVECCDGTFRSVGRLCLRHGRTFARRVVFSSRSAALRALENMLINTFRSGLTASTLPGAPVASMPTRRS